MARLDVRARPEQVWRTLTDYDRMHRFIPSLQRSRRLAIGREGPLVDQVAIARALVFKRYVRVLLQMREAAPETLKFRSVAGDFTRLGGIWIVEPLDGGRTLLRCRCVAVPRRSVPGPILTWATRAELAPRMRAIGREAERRERGP